ncbi:MAG: LacI family transcriptional regulator [Bifidobacteriaceae bacterium]|nr:LacI family transcriptional regulator [Bifidobacteriaceae bacterium]
MAVTPKSTLALVARRAKTSVATASKVLNGRPGVSEATRAKVRQAIDDLGYRPSTPRADEPGRAVTRITAIFRDLDATMYCAHILDAMLREARAQDVQVIVRLLGPLSDGDRRRMNRWARSLLGGGCQGAVFITSNLSREQIDACERVGLPLVAVDCDSLLDAGIVSISSNNFNGGYLAVRHLLDLGHRRIGLMIGRQSSAFARERHHGMVAAFRDAGLDVPGELVVQAGFTPQDGLNAGSRLLALDPRPTGIVANCDGSALGILAAAHEAGVEVPGDLSVVGFDGTAQSLWSTPRLTTVAQPLADIGRLTVTTIRQLIDGQMPYSHHVQLAAQLERRESTAPPRSETI